MPLHNEGKQTDLLGFMAERLSRSTGERHPSDVREDALQASKVAQANKLKQWQDWSAMPHESAVTLEGSSLRILREACGLSQPELGQLVGVDARTVESFESALNVAGDIFLPAFKKVAGAMRDALLEAS